MPLVTPSVLLRASVFTVDAVCLQSFSARTLVLVVVMKNSNNMNVSIDLGTIKVATSHTQEVELPKGDYTFGAGCGSCTHIHGMKDGKLKFTFTPNATGEQSKQIFAYNSANGDIEHKITFTANVVL